MHNCYCYCCYSCCKVKLTETQCQNRVVALLGGFRGGVVVVAIVVVIAVVGVVVVAVAVVVVIAVVGVDGPTSLVL